MHDWHVTPDYINTHWTEEMFLLLFKKRNVRMRLEAGEKPKENIPVDLFLFHTGVKVKEF